MNKLLNLVSSQAMMWLKLKATTKLGLDCDIIPKFALPFKTLLPGTLSYNM